jgi:excinuclease ABC subunit A
MLNDDQARIKERIAFLMDNSTLVIRGAREHNLRNVDLDLPRNQLVVFTGVSGSGKSSLAFDTLYAEGQRRYVESLSAYARQFLGQLQKPDVDYLAGLSPAISIQQKAAGKNPRSTVGTITEIHDYLRVLFARVGQGHCPICDRPITAQSREQILQRILGLPEGTQFLVLAPVVRGQKGEYKDLFQDMLKRGFLRARVDGEVVRLSDELKLDRRIKHHIEIVIDRLIIGPAASLRGRLAEAIEQALLLGEGNLIVAPEPEIGGRKSEVGGRGSELEDDGDAASLGDVLLSAHYACTHCQKSYEPPSPQMFSFNSPQGMCPDCDGLGMSYTFDPDLLIPDPSLSFFDGALPLIGAMRGMGRWRKHIYEGVAATLGIDLKTPWQNLPEEHRQWLLHGAADKHITYTWKQRGGAVWKHGGTWEGILPQLLASFKKTAAGPRRMQLEKYMRVVRCLTCKGQRLNPQARHVRVGGKTLVELGAMPLGDLAKWLGDEPGEVSPTRKRGLGGKPPRDLANQNPRLRVGLTPSLEERLDPVQQIIAAELLKEIRGRVAFLLNVGLHYLTLDRAAPSLSGGETQRIRLAGQIGSGLAGVLYVLDEPSIGLHPRDNDRLLQSLLRLRDLGNTVIVVEHDEDTMRAADFLVDFGPGPGVRGGEVIAAGSFADILNNPRSLTGQYLSGALEIPVPESRRPPKDAKITIRGARHHNLKGIDVDIPLGLFVCVTGVSGSGKSSLINDILKTGLKTKLGSNTEDDEDEVSPKRKRGKAEEPPDSATPNPRLRVGLTPGAHDDIVGWQQIDKVIDIDQSPIGRTPRSNPATYIKVFDQIRDLYAQMAEAKVRGYLPGRFSFNKPGGRCEACEGNGSNRLEMDFLADVWVKCPVCEGHRFNRETLQIRFKDKNIHDVLEMDIDEALEHFTNIPRIRDMLKTLKDVGLDYLKLGQPSPTLSGGEAQRIKLARELCRRSTGKTLYVLDEPTTGLHFADIHKLLQVLHGFVAAGNTVVVIEHNLDVMKTADWIIDLGPEGGAEGGEIVCAGTPEDVEACARSYTGQAMKGRDDGARSASKGKPSLARRAQNGQQDLTVTGAEQHNLKNVSVTLPREKMTVCCGPSGSGKSSLALDTIFAEGQRRYVESLSSYARQFLGQMQKPKVESVSGLSPAISIEQQTTSKSPRSTVGTVTEIYDYLRILYARLGQPYCPACQIPIGTQTSDEIIDKIHNMPEGTKLYLLAPIERRGQESYDTIFDEIRRSGFVRLRVDGRSYNVSELPDIDHRRKHAIEVVADRFIVRHSQRSRLADAVETALDLGRGVMHVAHVDDQREEPTWKVDRFSQHYACDRCGRSFEPLNPHHFSFNSPLGWCPVCEGMGVQKGANPTLLVRDPSLSLRQGALAAWPEMGRGGEGERGRKGEGRGAHPFLPFAEAIAKHGGFTLDTPFEKLDSAQQRVLFHGTGDAWLSLLPGEPSPVRGRSAMRYKTAPSRDLARQATFQYKGVMPALDEASRISFVYRQRLDSLVSDVPCGKCQGSRLRDDASACRFAGHTIGEVGDWPLDKTLTFFRELKLTKDHQQVAGEVLREIRNRLQFLVDVGLDYLSLSRATPTLSGGESQRIRLASQIGSGLTGVLYVLDEPTIGLHPRDNRRLLSALENLRDLGNTLILVEHDREVINAADYLLDFGPGAGARGGEITAQGTPKQILRAKGSLTGQYLSGKKAIPVPTPRRGADVSPTRKRGVADAPDPRLRVGLTIKGARQNNLRNLDVTFPLGRLIAVTGVSGSGKSSLVHEILYSALARKLHRAKMIVGAHDDILGLDLVDKVINVDQDPIGNSPNSNPATYTGVFDLIRQLFAQLPESRMRGYQAKRFSFNVKGGRCEVCEGNGQKKIEMHFLPDVWVPCDTCQGSRYTPETLAVRYKGKNIADVLMMSVQDALELLGNVPKIRRVLQTLVDVGLEYLALGQAAPTLSGGEAQRVKLAAELARPNTGKTVYILDEPTTGLHFDDIRKLLGVLNRLVDLGNTVIVVEHNLDVIKTADWIIDLGPEGGTGGGRIVAQGTPEEVAGNAESHTARFLAPVLEAGPVEERKQESKAEDVSRGKAAKEPEDDADMLPPLTAVSLPPLTSAKLPPLTREARSSSSPWETDGRLWHTQQRMSHNGTPCRWEGEIVNWVEKKIHSLGKFAETNWKQPTVVEIAGAQKGLGWFCHMHTAMEWLVRLVFSVGKDTFQQDDLEESLAIPTLNDTPGVEIYSNEPRVHVANRKGAWQHVWMLVHRLSEIQTPAFEAFLRKAATSFQQQVKQIQTKPEDVMPWKVNGERWHLGDKGFPPGQKVRWDRGLLPRLLEIVRAVEPAVVVEWDSRAAITLRVPGMTRLWAQWKTKETDMLTCRFVGKKGQFNLSQLEGLGVEPSLQDQRDGEATLLRFQNEDHLPVQRLKEWLARHLSGARE